MRRALLATTSTLLLGSAWSQSVLINEDFENYAAGDLVAQSAGLPWSTWSVAPGGSEDASVSDEQAYSGVNSFKVEGVAAGGPTDLILRLGNRSTGSYALSWFMYIPSGFGGYFNIQHNEVPGNGSWMADITFAPDGTIEYLVNNVAAAGSYAQDEWFSVIMAIDLDAGTGTVAINGTVQYSWLTTVPGPSQLGGIDFFAYAGGAPSIPTFYIDDVLFVDLGTLSVEEFVSQDVRMYPNPTSGALTVDWGRSSTSAIVSVMDLTGRVAVPSVRPSQLGVASRALIDLSMLPAGVYFVKVADAGEEIVRRVVKQ